MEYQWYPGHMTKAIRQMQEDMKLIDLVIELIDSRIPMSSRNPLIDDLAKNKSRLILLNKMDLADEKSMKEWQAYFEEKGFFVASIDARNKKSVRSIDTVIEKACATKRERDARRGIKNRPIRAMVVGIPNIGKSTFINTYAGKASAKTGNRPCVTKGKQWIKINKNVELLDTPGILWPKFEDQTIGLHIAAIGAIRDEIMQKEELAMEVISLLIKHYPGCLNRKYQIDEEGTQYELLDKIAVSRNCLKSGGIHDIQKAATFFLDDFRSAALGPMSLEFVKDYEEIEGKENESGRK